MTRIFLFVLLVLCCLAKQASLVAEKINDAECIKSTFSGTFVRGYVATGMVDPNYVYNANLLYEHEVNWAPYMVPCYKCGNPRKQVTDMIEAVQWPHTPIAIYVSTDRQDIIKYIKPWMGR